MPANAISLEDRRRQVRLVGNDLIKNYGRKPHYTVLEVKNANRRQGVKYDVACWSHSMFNSHADFDRYHESIGESCNYVQMKSEMLASVSSGASSGSAEAASTFDFDLSWLEFPDIDLSLFDLLDL